MIYCPTHLFQLLFTRNIHLLCEDEDHLPLFVSACLQNENKTEVSLAFLALVKVEKRYEPSKNHNSLSHAHKKLLVHSLALRRTVMK